MLTAHDAAAHVFARRVMGYSSAEVEALRSRLVSALAESERGLTKGLMVGSAELSGLTFARRFRGYDRTEVAEFIASAAATLEHRGVHRGSGHKRVTSSELKKVRFRGQVDGYKPAAVRRHLARAAAALDAHHAGRSPLMSRREAEQIEFPLRFWGWSCEDVETVCERISSTLLFYEARGPVARLEPDGGSAEPK